MGLEGNPNTATTTDADKRPEERLRGGLRRDSTGYESELRRWFQGRLRLLSLFIGIAAAALLALSHLVAYLGGVWEVGLLVDAHHLIHAASCLVAFGVWWTLRRRPHSARTLMALDGLLFGTSMATIVGIHATSYAEGLPVMGGILALFILTRALMLPSTVRRTVAYSVPGPIAFLAVQVAHGTVYMWPGQAMPDAYLLSYLLTGEPAYEGSTVVELAAAHLHKVPVPPSSRVPGVPADLEALLLSCLEKDPQQRPASAAEMRERLLACADAAAWTPAQAQAGWAAHKSAFA